MQEPVPSTQDLCALAAFVAGTSPGDLPSVGRLHQAGEPAEILDCARAVAADVTRRHHLGERRGEDARFLHGPPEQPQHWSDWNLVADLFGWLLALPEDLARLIASGTLPSDGLSLVGVVSHQSPFVSFLELVHDVWEHVCHSFTPQFDAVIKKQLVRFRPERVVDYGAGAGYFTSYLASLGSTVAAIEPNAVKQSFLRYRARRMGVADRISFDLPPAGAVDCVLAINVFDHLPDASDLVRQLAGLLPPGGLLCYQAAFPADGHHTSDNGVIDRVFRCLHTLFEVVFASPVPHLGFEVMRKRATASAEPLGPGGELLAASRAPEGIARDRLIPRLHPTISVDFLEDRRGAIVLHSPLFYIRDMVGPAGMLPLLRLCDGTRSMAEIATAMRAMGGEEPRVFAAIDRLWERRVVTVSVRG